jgi:hypothetical protein
LLAAEREVVMPTRRKSADVSVSVEAVLEDGQQFYVVKVSRPVFEVNVRVPSRDVQKFTKVRTTPWESGSLRIGESAGAPAFWALSEDGTVSILIGHDDEIWDIAVSVPPDTIEEILREIEASSHVSNREHR